MLELSFVFVSYDVYLNSTRQSNMSVEDVNQSYPVSRKVHLRKFFHFPLEMGIANQDQYEGRIIIDGRLT